MSIFIRFNNVDYKSPNKLIIGRGHPFKSNDLTFAREHAQIIKNSGGIFLSKKSKKLKLKINGKEIIDCKPHKLSPGMGFYLGESYFEIPEIDPTEYENIQRVYFTSSQFFSIENIGNIYFVSSFFFWAFWEYNAPVRPLSNYLFSFILCMAFAVIIKVYFKFLKAISNESKLLGKEIILTQDGMTIYFVNGSNFSFKFADIKGWSHKGLITTINCYDKTVFVQSAAKKLFFPPTKNDVGELPYYLMKNAPSKENKSDLYTIIFLRTLTVYPLFYFGFFYDYTESIELIILNLFLPFVLYGILIQLLRKDKMRRIWYLYDEKNKNYRSNQNYLLTLIFFGYAICIYDAFNNYKLLPELKIISSCAGGNKMNCEKMNYNLIKKKGFYLFDENIQTITKKQCDQGIQDACLFSSDKKNNSKKPRGIASEFKR